jgi:hypothetical protein
MHAARVATIVCAVVIAGSAVSDNKSAFKP